MKKLLLLLLLVCIKLNAQTNQISLLVGYKAIETSYTYTNDETELIFGVSTSIVDSNVAQDRANKNDKGKYHNFKNDVVPTVFGLIGGKFDNLSIIGKIGTSYVKQTINDKLTEDLFLALGIRTNYQLNNRISLSVSYDSVNSILGGITLQI